MATTVIMPKLGMAMAEGVLAKWLKHDGDEVKQNDEIAVIMSKKITYKLKAPAAGILRVVVREKETRPINTPLAFITAPGEPVPTAGTAAPQVVAPTAAPPSAAAAPAAPAPAAPGKAGFVAASPAARRLAKEASVDLALVAGTGAEGLITEADVKRWVEASAQAAEALATSAARKLAEQRGLKLADIPGTGLGGRITEQDVLAFEAKAQAPAPAVAAPAAGRVIPFVGMRQAIAEHMVESLQTMAQLTLMMEVDVTELAKLREQIKADFEVTYTDLLIKAVAKTLKRHPSLNATLIGNEVHQLDSVHIGVAVALPEGLIVPVVRDADQRTVQDIAQTVRRLAQGARDGSLSVDEVTGSTFTLTNLGTFGIDGFTPIINAPEAAILGVGRIGERVVVYQDQIARRKMMTLSLTVDHRLVDGAPGGDFLRSLKELLENPYRLLI